MNSYEKLEARFLKISRLNDIRNISQWDEAVMMPAGASPGRNEALAELAAIIQELSIRKEIGDWIADARQLSLNDWQKANLREMHRVYVEQTAIPTDLNRRLVVARMNCEQKWRTLRAENDWKGFYPYLNELLELTREMLGRLGEVLNLSPYDAALGMFSPGLNTETVRALFGEIRQFLPQMIQDSVELQKMQPFIAPRGRFPMAAQKALGQELMQRVGFATSNGRLDESHHPFCGGTSRDVRITTRYNNDEFVSSLMGVLHETGHGLYEQNLPEKWLGQPVGAACGMSIHESQSLFMEMQICRSAEFVNFAAPSIRKHLGQYVDNPESLHADNLVRLLSRVSPGLIRVDADEVTYPAHIILRFEIESALLTGSLKLSDLPEAWDEKMKQLLGLSTSGNDKNGCMQDVHWPSGSFGYFPAYTFGAVIAAQLFVEMQKALPNARAQIAQGDFAQLQSWLRDRVWSQGSRLQTLDLVKSASGRALSTQDFHAHLKRRYLNS